MYVCISVSYSTPSYVSYQTTPQRHQIKKTGKLGEGGLRLIFVHSFQIRSMYLNAKNSGIAACALCFFF